MCARPSCVFIERKLVGVDCDLWLIAKLCLTFSILAHNRHPWLELLRVELFSWTGEGNCMLNHAAR